LPQPISRQRRERKRATPVRVVRKRGKPVTQTNLTPAERELLPDLSRVTEDDADAIIGLRRERAEKPVRLVRESWNCGLIQMVQFGRTGW
jgi:hypothetical protein